MCFRLYLVVWQIHYLPIYYYIAHLFSCQELFRKRKDGVGFHRHHGDVFLILLVVPTILQRYHKANSKSYLLV